MVDGPYLVQFVDSIVASPVIRLDLCSGVWILQPTSDLSPPGLRRATVSTLLADGAQVPAAAYDNRVVHLVLRLRDASASADVAAGHVQRLARELDRPTNILRWQPGTTSPVFFRTLRAEYDGLHWDPVEKTATVMIPAEPFAYGLEEVPAAVTVSNDPSAVTAPMNTNPYFETNAAGWTPRSGTTFARSTLQFHEGAASGLMTPDGVQTTAFVEATPYMTVLPGAKYRSSVWLRCAVARTVFVDIDWYTAASVFISATQVGFALSATTWTKCDVEGNAPATAALATIGILESSTPPAGHTLHIDEAMLVAMGTANANGCYFDVTGVKGDVDTPLFLNRPVTNCGEQSLFAVRRRGTPYMMPFLVQAEAMTQNTDTTTQANSATFSGVGNNYSRTTFATGTMSNRLSILKMPTSATVDARGSYRVFARMRKNGSTSTITTRLIWASANAIAGTITNDTVTVTGTNVQMIDLGAVSMPVGADPVHNGYDGPEIIVEGIYLRVDAARVAGTDTLDIDYLLLIPSDDRLSIVAWSPDGVAGTADNLVLDGFNELTFGYLGATGELCSMGSPYFVGGLPMLSPNVTNRIVHINEVMPATAETTWPTTWSFQPYYWPRYLFVAPVGS